MSLEEFKALRDEILETVRTAEKLYRFNGQIERLLSDHESEKRTHMMHDERLSRIEFSTFGNERENRMGTHQKVGIMWRFHVWILCLLSGGAGSVITYVFNR